MRTSKTVTFKSLQALALSAAFGIAGSPGAMACATGQDSCVIAIIAPAERAAGAPSDSSGDGSIIIDYLPTVQGQREGVDGFAKSHELRAGKASPWDHRFDVPKSRSAGPLGSLQSLGSANELFANNRGGGSGVQLPYIEQKGLQHNGPGSTGQNGAGKPTESIFPTETIRPTESLKSAGGGAHIDPGAVRSLNFTNNAARGGSAARVAR